jgi:hypothetical protein
VGLKVRNKLGRDITIMPAGFVEFLESHLGEMSGGSHFTESPKGAVTVARFDNQPVSGACTYVTLGLSHHALHQLKGPDLRIELLGCVWNQFANAGLDSLLFILAEDILRTHHAPPQGSVVGPQGPIAPNSSLEAFIFFQPMYHDDALDLFQHESEPVYLVWPVPITAAEAAFVADRGWSEFERVMLSRDPDLMDLHRASCV